MSSWLAPISETTKSALNIVKSIGPLLISQSDGVSESYVRHLSRLASVEAAKELVHREIDIYCKAKELLFQQYVEADELKRIQIKRDIEYIASDIRHLKIVETAINSFPDSPQSSDQVSVDEKAPASENKTISLHWLDKFSEFSRSMNEDWRADLLSRALATESTTPGSISLRALWLLGTLEDEIFKAFATILDLCSVIDQTLMILETNQDFMKRSIPNCELGEKISISNLLYILGDVGLLASPDTWRNLPQGYRFPVKYNSHNYYVESSSDSISLGGVIPSPLGLSIASLYQPKYNSLGEEIFLSWINGLSKTVTVTKI